MTCKSEALLEAARQVERWWLDEGMKAFDGAPACIFNLRAALSQPVAAPQAEMAGDIGSGNRDCLAKRRPGEPMFILLGRDPDAHNIVRLWAQRRLEAGDPSHATPVLALAGQMEDYAADPANAPTSAPEAKAYPPITPPQPEGGTVGERP